MAQKVVNGTFETSEAKGFSWNLGWRKTLIGVRWQWSITCCEECYMRYAEDVNHITHTHIYIYIRISNLYIFSICTYIIRYTYTDRYIYNSVYSYIILISHPEKLPKRSSILDLLDVSQPRRIWGKVFLSLEKYPLKGWNPMNSGNLKGFFHLNFGNPPKDFFLMKHKVSLMDVMFCAHQKAQTIKSQTGTLIHDVAMKSLRNEKGHTESDDLEQWWPLKKNRVCLTFEIEGIWDGCR